MAIEIQGLTKIFPSSDFKLQGINLSFPSKDISVIIGKNGCGKSTLLNCIAGLLPFEGGNIHVTIDGVINYSLPSGVNPNMAVGNRKKIGYIFQQKALWQHLSILANITHPLINVHGLTKEQAVNRAMEYLALLKLDNISCKKYPNSLSGGQQRKLAIARTFAIEPELLLIDELEANLDQSALKLTLDILKNKFIDKQKTVLIISHSIDLLEQFTPNIVVLHQGKVRVESAKGTKELLTKDDNDRIIKDSVDSSSKRWFLANQSLEAAIKISEINLAEKDSKKLFTHMGMEISKLISRFEPEKEHLLLIATRTKASDSTPSQVKICCAEKSEGFILNGGEAPKLDGLICAKTVVQGQTVYKFIENYRDFFQNSGGFNLMKKTEAQTPGHNSLIDEMFETNGQLLEYQYSDRHQKIKGVYNISVPIPIDNLHGTERMSYYDFSINTRNVYLIGCIIENEVKGIISIDTCAEEKWSDFIIQQLILIGNMVAIAIKNHE